jgi:thiol:disulfide interchange protein DsbD
VKNKLIHIVIGLFLVLLSFGTRANDSTGIVIELTKQRLNESNMLVTIKATIPGNAKLYALQSAENNTLFSSIVFDSAFHKLLSGEIEEKGLKHSEKDVSVDAAVTYYADSVLWRQNIIAGLTDSFSLKGTVSYLYKKGDEYLPGEKNFKVQIQPEEKDGNDNQGLSNKSLIWIFLTAFGGGLLALLTPCVYSMIPVTVSFFTKRSKSKKEGIKNALYYSSSIILIFTLLGFLITLVFGPAALNNLATNWIANLIFFAVFVLFGVSFLGAFEIMLPSSWANKTDSKASVGSFAGIFFMALTLVVVSFSCTGPIIGNLLVMACKGKLLGSADRDVWFFNSISITVCTLCILSIETKYAGKSRRMAQCGESNPGFFRIGTCAEILIQCGSCKRMEIIRQGNIYCRMDSAIHITRYISFR